MAMLELVHPDELSPRVLYQQANTLATKTSRAFQKDWYRSALDLPFQWHLWVDGGQRVVSAIHDAKTGWQPGPDVNPSFFLSPDGAEKVLATILNGAFSSAKPKSLGVILHIADEFNLADLAPESRMEADFDVLKQQLLTEPAEVLADKKINPDASAWRLLPYWGAEPGNLNCSTIVVSQDRQEFMRRLRRHGDETNIPVRTVALSAPLVALAAAPLIAPVGQGEAHILVYQYLKFTVLFAINPKGELISARTLPHRGAQGLPANFSQVVVSMAINHNMTNPAVYHFAMSQVVIDTLLQELRAYSSLHYELHILSPSLEEIPALAQIPAHRPELCLHHQAKDAEHHRNPVYKDSQSFSCLIEGWGLQDFDRAQEEDQWYPTQIDLQILKLSSAIIMLMLICAVMLCIYGGVKGYQTIHDPIWNLTPEVAAASTKKLDELTEEKKTLDYAENLFVPRSRGWQLLEFLQQIVPAKPGQVRLDKLDYSITPVVAEVTAAPKGKGKPVNEKVGFTREWKISGLAQHDEFTELAKLNSRSGLHDFFKKFAQGTGDQGFDPDPETRTVSAQITKRNNETYNPEAKPQMEPRDLPVLYPVSFEILLTQTFTDRDPLALIKKKPTIPGK